METGCTSSRNNKIIIKNKIMKKSRCQTGRTTTITFRRRRLLIHMTITMNRWTLKKFVYSCTTPTTILLAEMKKNNFKDQIFPVDTIIRNRVKKMIIITT